MKTVFFTDLDNTIIYSCRHEIGRDKLCVELYQGREVSFVTEKTWELLRRVNEETLLVPVTTRTKEQYDRIDLRIGTPGFALVCNGGILLEDGVENHAWYQESLALTADCREELNTARRLMEQDQNRSFEVRNIRELFLFTKSSQPQQSVEDLKSSLDTELVCVFQNGVKVYVLPIIGNAKSSIDLMTGPFVRSLFIALYPFISGQRNIFPFPENKSAAPSSHQTASAE